MAQGLGFLHHRSVRMGTASGTVNDEGESRELIDCALHDYRRATMLFYRRLPERLFSVVKNQYVREAKCIALGDPYCEWVIN